MNIAQSNISNNNIQSNKTIAISNDNALKYLSTIELLRRIVEDEDRLALNYFLSNRKVIQFGKARYSIPKFLQIMRSSNFYPIINTHVHEKHLDEKLDHVYDRTLQKFSILKTNKGFIDGPFCNRQYEVILRKLNEHLNTENVRKQIEIEIKSEAIIKQSIYRHINYSWLEVC
ncbi:MAG: hypothetical protein H6611_10385, partial [Ignavibacteriales bacterium]|nr:hypothetical protein [Ignavibacteriales bacterium]